MKKTKSERNVCSGRRSVKSAGRRSRSSNTTQPRKRTGKCGVGARGEEGDSEKENEEAFRQSRKSGSVETGGNAVGGKRPTGEAEGGG